MTETNSKNSMSSANKIDLMKKSKNKLMKSIPFIDEELKTNEDLRLSDSQKNRLKPTLDLYLALSVIGSFISFCFSFIFFLIGNNSTDYLFFTGICILVFGIGFYGVFHFLKISNQIKKGYGVKKVEGNPVLNIAYVGEDNDVPVYSVVINEVKFVIDEQIYDSFNGDYFRVYYFTIFKNYILSAEPLN